ncbi:MAG: T9SS type A sorting domain-containing protein [Flavobacteriales bacterium]|nr:T9SS type A sorting domain-containing protein [Flavobacteriales bacterium]
MERTLTFLLVLAGMQASTLHAQPVLNEATSIPALQRMENHNVNSVFPVPTLTTTGSNNTWDASSATWGGTYIYCWYQPPTASPNAANYPTATLCAYAESNSFPQTYLHFNTSSSAASFLGEGTDVYPIPEQVCAFPMSIGSTFTTTYQPAGGPVMTHTMTYAAAGSLITPWDTVTNVVMFSSDNSSSFVLYKADNMLFPIGVYTPGLEFEVHQVEVFSAVPELTAAQLHLWPNPARDEVTLDLADGGPGTFTARDMSGRVVLDARIPRGTTKLDVSHLASGVYMVSVAQRDGRTSVERLVIDRP